MVTLAFTDLFDLEFESHEDCDRFIKEFDEHQDDLIKNKGLCPGDAYMRALEDYGLYEDN